MARPSPCTWSGSRYPNLSSRPPTRSPTTSTPPGPSPEGLREHGSPRRRAGAAQAWRRRPAAVPVVGQGARRAVSRGPRWRGERDRHIDPSTGGRLVAAGPAGRARRPHRGDPGPGPAGCSRGGGSNHPERARRLETPVGGGGPGQDAGHRCGGNHRRRRPGLPALATHPARRSQAGRPRRRVRVRRRRARPRGARGHHRRRRPGRMAGRSRRANTQPWGISPGGAPITDHGAGDRGRSSGQHAPSEWATPSNGAGAATPSPSGPPSWDRCWR